MSDAVAAPQPWRLDAGMGFWTVHQGDARNTGRFLSEAALALGVGDAPFLQTTVTSPPYATLVDYGSENQIGYGQTHDNYLAACKAVFQDVYRWTVTTGSMWVVADSLMEKRRKTGSASRLIPLPFELAIQAEAVGWTLREVVIWRKDRTRPWSHHGKLRNGFEYVLFFVKSDDFIFNVDSLRDTNSLKSWWIKYPERHNPWGMAPDNVWDIPIPVQGSWDNSAFRHACPFPPELVRRMVALSSDQGDIVFDPFAGSGAVVSGANREGRRGLGTEINSEYVDLYRKTSLEVLRPKVDPKPVSAMTQRLLELRMLKYPKELAKQILRGGFTTSQIRAILMEVESVNYRPARSGYGEISCSVVTADDISEMEVARLRKIISEASERPPLSKYGLAVRTDVILTSEIGARFEGGEVSVYRRGRTWNADFRLDGSRFGEWIRTADEPTVVPIVSPLHVRQSLEESL